MAERYQIYAGVVLVFAILGFMFFAWMVYFLVQDFDKWLKKKKLW